MIHANRIVTVGEQESIIDRPIILYRGDREVEIEFTLVGNEFMFSEEGNVIKSVNASHGQLVLNTPSGEHMFSELAECHEGKVVFVVTKEMIDEFIEMGFYSFQIRLYDSVEMKSRVTIPPVMNGFDIRNPIAAEDETNVVDQGIVDYARIFKDQSNEELHTFDWTGAYNKTEWAHHDLITENKMNKIEDALYSINATTKELGVTIPKTLDQVKKNADKYVKDHMAEVETDIEEFERNLNTDVQKFKIDTNAAMTAHKNEVAQLTQYPDKVAGVFNVKKFICDDGEYVKGDGEHDDTTGIQKAIDYCAENSCSLFFPAGTYYITDTIKIFKSSKGRHQFRINFNNSQIITDKPITMVQVYNIEGSEYAQSWSVYLDNLNLNGARIATVGLHNKAQGTHINSLYVDQCMVGLKSENVYYGTYEGHNIINNCNKGIEIVGTENNAVNFKNMWIVGGARYDEVNSVGIDLQTRCLDLVISDVTIEGYAYGIKPTTMNYGVSHLTIRNCYFERIEQSYIDLSASAAGHYYICTIDNCHGNEVRSDLAQAAVKLGRGTFRVAHNNFKDNYIQLTNIATNVETDMEVVLNEEGIHSGWQQVVRKIPNSRLINEINKYDDHSTNLMRIASENDMFKVTPAMNIMAKDMTFIEQNSVVIQSPNKTFYRICVNDDGTLTTARINNQERRVVLPTYNTVSMTDILAEDFITNYKYGSVTVRETNLTYYLENGQMVSRSTYSNGLHPFGDIQYILTAIDIINVKLSWASIFIYNTDINKYYVAQGGIWSWAGDIPYKDASNIRAIGKTSERPSNAIEGLIYYDTDINGYIKWNGSQWVNM